MRRATIQGLKECAKAKQASIAADAISAKAKADSSRAGNGGETSLSNPEVGEGRDDHFGDSNASKGQHPGRIGTEGNNTAGSGSIAGNLGDSSSGGGGGGAQQNPNRAIAGNARTGDGDQGEEAAEKRRAAAANTATAITDRGSRPKDRRNVYRLERNLTHEEFAARAETDGTSVEITHANPGQDHDQDPPGSGGAGGGATGVGSRLNVPLPVLRGKMGGAPRVLKGGRAGRGKARGSGGSSSGRNPWGRGGRYVLQRQCTPSYRGPRCYMMQCVTPRLVTLFNAQLFGESRICAFSTRTHLSVR